MAAVRHRKIAWWHAILGHSRRQTFYYRVCWREKWQLRNEMMRVCACAFSSRMSQFGWWAIFLQRLAEISRRRTLVYPRLNGKQDAAGMRVTDKKICPFSLGPLKSPRYPLRGFVWTKHFSGMQKSLSQWLHWRETTSAHPRRLSATAVYNFSKIHRYLKKDQAWICDRVQD